MERFVTKKKLHYFMVSGSVTFRNPAEEGSLGSYPFNAVVTNEVNLFPVRMIGKAQQSLQLQFFQKMEDPSLEVVDVHLLSVTHLGWMTEKEFHGEKPAKTETPVVADNPYA